MLRKSKAMATGSLKSRSTKMEWTRYEAQHMKRKTKGGTWRAGTNVSPAPSLPTTHLRPGGPEASTHLGGLVVYQENEHQGDKVEHSKDVLGHRDVRAPVSGVVQPRKDVQKPSWVAGRREET